MSQDLIAKLNALGDEARSAFSDGRTEDELYQVKVRFLGKKGLLTDILKGLGAVSEKDRPVVGAEANRLKDELENTYQQKLKSLKNLNLEKTLQDKTIDITLPGIRWPRGHIHPVSRVLSEMKKIFREMGFDIHEGPEIETDYYNFEALNIPQNHPARDMQDTLYLEGTHPPKDRWAGRGVPLLLRTHTSPVQIRVMEKKKPPIQMISPGVVYRRDSDVSHSPMFHQIEGLMIDRNITLGDLKGVVELFLKQIFDPGIPVKFRPSFFPFTEPSAEVDIGCVICKRKGCRVCGYSGWVEIMGCGMVDPNVFEFVDIDSEKYTGFAFGIGIERVAMLKYGIDDIRLFFENDVKFLEQF